MKSRKKTRTREELERENRVLRAQLAEKGDQLTEAQELLRAIHQGEVDALVVSTPGGQRVYTLQSADQTYRTIVEQMQEGAVTLVEDGLITFSNQRFADLVQRPLEHIIGSHLREYVVEFEQDRLQRLLRQSQGGPAWGETTFRGRDGTLVPIRLGLSLLDLDGQAVTCAIVTNLTEQKQAEAVLASEQFVRRLIEHASIGVAVVGRDLRYVLANPAYEALADGPVGGRAIGEVFPPSVAGIFQPLVQQVLDSGRPLEVRECEVPFQGRTWWNLSQIPLRNQGEEIEAVLILAQEVTQQQLAQEALWERGEELRRLKEELEVRVEQRTTELAAANKELEAFGYTVSHDLRAPLRHLVGFVELLGDHAASLDGEGREFLKIIAESAGRMASLIDDLLILSRLGRTAMTLTKVDLGGLAEEAIAELAPAISGRSIHWQVGPLPRVCGDQALLRNVLVNLVSNAVKYSRRRQHAHIEIGSEQQDNEVVCYVRDNGAGFDMQFVDKLFGVFQRLHVAEEFEGTGIGLASVRRIIQRHGGRVWAEGAVDQGATFYFALPKGTGE